MNQAWIERTQHIALRARYRDSGHSTETPTDYYIRKIELLSLVYNFTPSQVMSEVLQKAPRLWSTILNPMNFTTLAVFQTAVKYHEDLLIEFGEHYNKFPKLVHSPSKAYTYKVDSKSPNKNTQRRNQDRRIETLSLSHQGLMLLVLPIHQNRLTLRMIPMCLNRKHQQTTMQEDVSSVEVVCIGIETANITRTNKSELLGLCLWTQTVLLKTSWQSWNMKNVTMTVSIKNLRTNKWNQKRKKALHLLLLMTQSYRIFRSPPHITIRRHYRK